MMRTNPSYHRHNIQSILQLLFLLVQIHHNIHSNLFVHGFSVEPSSSTKTSSSRKIIQICQNKDCCKNFPSKYDGGLPQTIKDLIPDQYKEDVNNGNLVIETTGCLSHCNRGPNVNVKKMGDKDGEKSERVFGSIDGVLAAAVALDVGLDIDCPGELMAAIESMASSTRGELIR